MEILVCCRCPPLSTSSFLTYLILFARKRGVVGDLLAEGHLEEVFVWDASVSVLSPRVVDSR